MLGEAHNNLFINCWQLVHFFLSFLPNTNESSKQRVKMLGPSETVKIFTIIKSLNKQTCYKRKLKNCDRLLKLFKVY